MADQTSTAPDPLAMWREWVNQSERQWNAFLNGIDKIMAHMTVDQLGARTVFQGMGFRAEALLRDHVRDRDGRTHDLLILSHEVSRFQARRDAYGVSDALNR